MICILRAHLAGVIVVAAVTVAAAQTDSEQVDQCMACHGNPELWEKDTLHLYVSAQHLVRDAHWQKGIKCQACHGGNANSTNLREAHSVEDGFRLVESPTDTVNFCARCHSDAAYMQRFRPTSNTDVVAEFWESVHGQHLKNAGADRTARLTSCTACHTKHDMRPSEDPQSSVNPRRLVETCGNCHKDQKTALRKGVHHAAGERNEKGAGTPLDCGKCHGKNLHSMPPVRDRRSPVFLDNQVEVCGACHEKFLATYDRGVHGRGLHESGLQITAVCADCHGAHDIYYAADKRSTLHATNVAVTCGKCHRFIEQRLMQSVHGRGNGPGGATATAASGGEITRKPSCVDCHEGHDQPHPESTAFRLQLPNRCGNCHADYSVSYRLSIHGELTRLGYEPAAKCSDCHGAHDILAVNDPQSRLSSGNRVETCKSCHSHAVASFTQFDPHANPEDEKRFPFLYHVHTRIETLVYVFFCLFLMHALLWFTRSFIHTLRYGRHERLVSQEFAIVRFAPVDRAIYCIVFVSFLGLIFTGLPLKYGYQPWAQRLAHHLGGFESTSALHHFFAVTLLSGSLVHVVWGVKRVSQMYQRIRGWRQLLFGPDSPLPNLRDVQDMLRMVRWFFGLGPKPVFERWTYWEKLDFWAVHLSVFMIATSGLMLWYPNVFCLILPGKVLNVAKVVHAESALLITSFVIIIHLFNTHFRPEKFPMDLSFLTGLTSEDHMRTARPQFLERMAREGRLEAIRVIVPPSRHLWPRILIGAVIFVVGVALLAILLIASMGK